ncbi:hypothetical protein [Novipirellula artificiosorum]|uniref:Uncharacterized protein n=1 Tax=Novipirellula artificiosorum TaxID=2528016 RepID=A0A5C6CSL9_9BACT|nr:hypothetical protein [Novipirellula artificiosorum]TWU27953.1 hypothetical protein Poly41_70270 [Novipirellula artificiosorum]
MRALPAVFVLVFSVTFGSSWSFAEEAPDKVGSNAVSDKLDSIANELRALEARIRFVESQVQGLAEGQSVELPVKCMVIPEGKPIQVGQVVAPGQILGRIVPVRDLAKNSEWIVPGKVILKIVR